MRFWVAILVISILLLSGCISETKQTRAGQVAKSNINEIVSKCVALCMKEKMNRSLENGPCLSNDIAPGWVCDVAHWPRQAVDNNPENQCPAYGKTAFAFVEVDPDCRPIRAWDGREMIILKQ